jgi:predicted O-methyltransferase YrrM
MREPVFFQSLVDQLHLGDNPYEQAREVLREEIEKGADLDYEHTHLTCELFEEEILSRIGNPSLIVEIGSFKGGSALRMAQVLGQRKMETPIVCIDTFLGDTTMWFERRERHFNLRFFAGRAEIYEVFLRNILVHEEDDRILPLPLSSHAGIRVCKHAHVKADVVYLDSCHLEGETLMELERAYNDLLAPGGIIFGDDFVDFWPGVVNDVTFFAGEMGLELVRFGERKDHWLLEKPAEASQTEAQRRC